MPDISLILPTRGRPSDVIRLFASILSTSSAPERLEVVLYLDEDDIESHDIEYSGLRIIKLIRPRDTMGNITRTCFESCSGRYIMLMNDDVVFRTDKWDRIVLSAFAPFTDNIALVYGNDLLQGKKLATFPILSRDSCNLLDKICPPEYVRFYIDAHIFDIYRKLLRLGHNRIVYLSDVIFEHLHYSIGKSSQAADNGRKSTLDEMVYMTSGEYRSYLARRLARHIETYAPAGCGDNGVKDSGDEAR